MVSGVSQTQFLLRLLEIIAILLPLLLITFQFMVSSGIDGNEIITDDTYELTLLVFSTATTTLLLGATLAVVYLIFVITVPTGPLLVLLTLYAMFFLILANIGLIVVSIFENRYLGR